MSVDHKLARLSI